MKTRDKLLTAAERCFGRHGFDGTSVRDIVSEAGVNLGAVTYHFGGKEQLFADLLATKTREMMAVGYRITESNLGPEDKLRAFFEEYATIMLIHQPSLKIIFAETLSGGTRLPAVVRDAVTWRNQAFADIMKDGIRQGVFRDGDIETLAWSFFGMLSAYILYEPLVHKYGKNRPYPKSYVKRIVSSATDAFMNGIKKPPKRRQPATRKRSAS
jgi:AcrR family transcriptional regulator